LRRDPFVGAVADARRLRWKHASIPPILEKSGNPARFLQEAPPAHMTFALPRHAEVVLSDNPRTKKAR